MINMRQGLLDKTSYSDLVIHSYNSLYVYDLDFWRMS